MTKFYITTAIDYPNGAPHMGHAYEKVVSDAYARWHRFLGDETFFLTGTDENGQKLVKAAQDAKKPTQAYVDENVVLFRKLCSDLLISNDDFIRTTEDRHKKSRRNSGSESRPRAIFILESIQAFTVWPVRHFIPRPKALIANVRHIKRIFRKSKRQDIFSN